MHRSQKCVFVSHCLLAQITVAKGLAKISPAMVKQVVQFCLDNDINVFQMPCPEINCKAGGVERDLHGKKWYEDNGLRNTSEQIAKEQACYMQKLISAGANILAIIGVEFSPACAPTYLNKGRSITRSKGIYIEELIAELKLQGLDIPIIGINQRWHRKVQRQLNELLA